MVQLIVNGKAQNIDIDPDTPVLWAVREQLGLNGTKFGCGASLCGACTVHIDGEPVRSCVTPLSCLLYTSPSPRDATLSRMPSSA